MTTYHPYKFNLSEGQKKKLLTAYGNKNEITIRLSNSDLTGNDGLMLSQRQINKLNKAKNLGVGSDLNISKTQIRKVMRVGHGAPRIGFPMIGMSPPKPKSKGSTTTKQPSKKNGGRIMNEKDALSYRSPPFIGSWDQYNKYLNTGVVIPKKKTIKK